MSKSKLVVGVSLFFLVVACTGTDADYCDRETPCGRGATCNYEIQTCVPSTASKVDGGAKSDGGGDATSPEGLFADAGTMEGGLGDTVPRSDPAARDAQPVDLYLPLRGLGQACEQGAQCDSGHCVDSVCCSDACEGTCRSCSIQSSEGTCTPLAEGTDKDGECRGSTSACDGTCDGQGACRFPGGEETAGCASASCADRQLTTYACDGQGECVGNAVDCGSCKQCASDGSAACEPIPADQPPPEGHCPGDLSCGAQSCDGKGGCAYLAEGTKCQDRTCNTVADIVMTWRCDEEHRCSANEFRCFPYACSGNTCTTGLGCRKLFSVQPVIWRPDQSKCAEGATCKYSGSQWFSCYPD